MRLSDLLSTALAAVALLLAFLLAPDPVTEPLTQTRRAFAPRQLPEVTRNATLAQGETFPRIAARLGVASGELPAWLGALDGVLDPRALPAGLHWQANIDMHGRVTRISVCPNWRDLVVLERTDAGVTGRRIARTLTRALTVVEGTVQSSLFDGVVRAGELETLAVVLADIFQWDVDFHREVRGGDSFALLVERVQSEGRTVAYGPVLAAVYVNRGTRHVAVRYAGKDARPAYYDEHGAPLRKQFLRAPLRFSRLTSRFSASRLHPILGRRLPHWGVDYAAPVGTPVLATADGTVAATEWRAGGGNAVELRHLGGYSSTYMHLSRFAAGMQPGVHVVQGQVLGYVGSTGLSTGPHLDYRVSYRGRHLNPLRVGGEVGAPLPSVERARFGEWSARVLASLSASGPVPATAVAGLLAVAPIRFDG